MGLLAKLLLALMAFPPFYIAVKYWRWSTKQDKEAELETEED
jgi:hypothetical protein